ncbi:unnamed protein product, partial [Effrenium voratum]
ERQIGREQFCAGLVALNYPGKAELLFTRLDIDQIEEVTLDQIDPEASRIWMGFRMWCVKVFSDEKKMLAELSGDMFCDLEAFTSNLNRLGWYGHEQTLFWALNRDRNEELEVKDFRFFAIDKRKYVRARKGMQDAVKLRERLARKRHLVAKARKEFKAFLKKKYGTILRAWRNLDADGSMYLQKNELFRAVKELSWQGDARLLWKGLDKDASGITFLQEVDLRSAEQLAKFKQQIMEKCGSAEALFRAMDVHKINKVHPAAFFEHCRRLGFSRVDKFLYHGLDWEGKKYLAAGDLTFLDSWKCPQYLVCSPSPQAAREFKSTLLQMYPSYLKAWRHLDRDGSNEVCWDEFEAAAKRLSFKGDVPGAWRFFDQETFPGSQVPDRDACGMRDASGCLNLHEWQDISGSISFRELDSSSFEFLAEFKSWADQEFGGVRAAFTVLDEDNSGDFTLREFIKMLRFYGFQGDCRAVYLTLDCEGQGKVSMNDLAFLDAWELQSHPIEEEPESLNCTQTEAKATRNAKVSPRLAELARSRKAHLPLLPVASKSTLESFTSTFSKPLLLKSVYGKLPDLSQTGWTYDFTGISGISGYQVPTGAALRRIRVKAIKDEILAGSIDDLQGLFSEDSDAHLLSIKNRTLALRSRTVELLSKAEDFEESRQVNASSQIPVQINLLEAS